MDNTYLSKSTIEVKKQALNKKLILSKLIICNGCRRKYTINYKPSQKEVKTVCADCGKHNTHKI